MTHNKRSQSPKLSLRATQILRLMVHPADGDDGELVGEKGQWWVDMERTSQRVVNQFLRLCLIKEIDSSNGFFVYIANDDARKLLENPNYETRIEEAMRTGENVYR